MLFEGLVGDVGLDVTLFGFGGTTGFCILEGLGGKGGRGVLASLPVVCLLIGLYVAGECCSMIFSMWLKHVFMLDTRLV
jgi:hypothetical protein